MPTDNHFEKLQHQYEAQQYFENENSTGDVSKVDKYKPHEDFDFQYRDYYDRQDKADK